MRVLQCYRFFVKTKIPFYQWPGIIEEFLRRQDLNHRIFHYYLESYDASDQSRAALNGTGCERALKEHPFLGPIKVHQTKYNTIQSLNNFTDESNDVKENIYAIIPKIYRRYGFSEVCLIYRDIDFFSQHIPTPPPETVNSIMGYEGSGITLYRSCLSNDNAISLVAESRYPGDVPDATPYANALSELLPGIKRLSCTQIIMDEHEQAHYEALNCQAKPLIGQATEFFSNRMPEEKGNDDPEARANVASHLKKLSKQYGYTYLGYNYYIYFLEKQLPNGHYICLEIVSNPHSPDADPNISLCGLGFNHDIWADGFTPQNSRDASEYLSTLFRVLAEAERAVFPPILNLYPPTPEWFMPTH